MCVCVCDGGGGGLSQTHTRFVACRAVMARVRVARAPVRWLERLFDR